MYHQPPEESDSQTPWAYRATFRCINSSHSDGEPGLGKSRLLAVENLHWIDPTSDAWLAGLVERLGDTPVLLLTTYRPGYQPPWIGHSAVPQMALLQLSPRDSLMVLQSVPQAAQLPAPLQQAIVATAAGNPFFVEELTCAAVEHGDPAGPLPTRASPCRTVHRHRTVPVHGHDVLAAPG